jgi:hypothetical protein
MKKIILMSLLAGVIAGCSMPNTTVRSVDSRPSLAIKGAPSSAKLIIDGLDVGAANTYNGDPQVLILEPGTHKVLVTDGSDVLYEQFVFVESELKNITLK